MLQTRNTPARFYSLDILRGLAALGVVLFHWQHFFYSGTSPGKIEFESFPLYTLAFVLYEHGWLAVDLFFSLSGFVFYWLYSLAIAKQSISIGHFWLLRFSRLYPLHFATLLLVAMGQFLFKSAHGSYFVYPFNDAKHFLLNVLFASYWGLEGGYSFNGPIWSVSVEVLMYALFFVFCRVFPVRIIPVAALSAIGFVAISSWTPVIGRGIGAFFLGGCVYFAYHKIISSRQMRIITNGILYSTIAAWAVTLFLLQQRVDVGDYLSASGVPFLWRIPGKWPVIVLFPMTILSLALVETSRGTLGKRLSFIGDISYSSYLLHFPLQLATVILVSRLALGNAVYYSPWFLGLFFLVLISISFCSYNYFEAPLQRAIRRMAAFQKVR